jgi:hypothetical protein
VTVSGAASGAYKFGRADCLAGKTAVFSWDFTGSNYQQGLYNITLRATKNSDCTANSAGDTTYALPTTATQGSSNAINLTDFLFDATAASTCSATSTPANPGSSYFCVVTYLATSPSTISDYAYVNVKYAMQPPSAPVSVAAEGGDSLLRVSWQAGNANDDLASTAIYVVPSGDAITTSTAAVSQVSAVTSQVVLNDSDGASLLNGSPYDVRLRALDSYNNWSDFSGLVTATPQPVDDFYRRYRGAGGQATGCSSIAGGWWAALGLGALLFAGRRRTARARGGRSAGRWASGPLTLLLALLLPPVGATAAEAGPAASTLLGDADAPVFVPRAASGPVGQSRSPRWLLVSVAFDQYNPNVDSEADLNGATPYADIFQGRVPWRVQAEVALEVWHNPYLGSALLGVTAGFWQNIGKGFYAGGPLAGQRSNDTALLNIWPLGLRATWRYDALADRWRYFPLIPYAQVGLMAAGWVAYNGAGEVAHARPPDTGKGAGWTTGVTAALGVAVTLDAIDPIISNEAYVDLGLQRTSLFAEYGWTKLDSFGSNTALILTDRAWRLGLAVEF